MAEQVEVKVIVTSDTKGAQDAKSALSGFGDSLKNVLEIATGVSLANMAEQIADVGREAAAFAVETAGHFEQTAQSMTTLLGSSKEAGVLLKQLSDWEIHTPFTLSQITDSAKQLIAANENAKDVLPTLKELSDISMGDPARLQELVSVWGEVNSLQEVNGRTILRLSSISVPIYQYLAQAVREMGVANEGASSSIVKGTKMSADQLTKLQDQIQSAKDHLTTLNDQTVKGTDKQKSHSDEIKKVSDNLGMMENKLKNANTTVKTFGGTADLSTEALKKMLSAGEITPAIFNKALEDMTKAGGKFHGETMKQSQTLEGFISSLHSSMQRLALSFMGIDLGSGDTSNMIEKGGLMDNIKNAAAGLLDWITNNRKAINNFFLGLGDLIANVWKVLKSLADFTVMVFTPVIQLLTQVYMKHKAQIDIIVKAVGVLLYGAVLLLITVLAAAIATVAELTDYFLDKFGPALKDVSDIIVSVAKNWKQDITSMRNDFINFVNGCIDAINLLIAGLNKIPNMHITPIGKMTIPGDLSATPTLGSTDLGGVRSSSGVSITNHNTFNTPYDPNNFAKQLGVQVSMAQS